MARRPLVENPFQRQSDADEASMRRCAAIRRHERDGCAEYLACLTAAAVRNLKAVPCKG